MGGSILGLINLRPSALAPADPLFKQKELSTRSTGRSRNLCGKAERGEEVSVGARGRFQERNLPREWGRMDGSIEAGAAPLPVSLEMGDVIPGIHREGPSENARAATQRPASMDTPSVKDAAAEAKRLDEKVRQAMAERTEIQAAAGLPAAGSAAGTGRTSSAGFGRSGSAPSRERGRAPENLGTDIRAETKTPISFRAMARRVINESKWRKAPFSKSMGNVKGDGENGDTVVRAKAAPKVVRRGAEAETKVAMPTSNPK